MTKSPYKNWATFRKLSGEEASDPMTVMWLKSNMADELSHVTFVGTVLPSILLDLENTESETMHGHVFVTNSAGDVG